jgi:hypothetical protein
MFMIEFTSMEIADLSRARRASVRRAANRLKRTTQIWSAAAADGEPVRKLDIQCRVAQRALIDTVARVGAWGCTVRVHPSWGERAIRDAEWRAAELVAMVRRARTSAKWQEAAAK